MILIILSNVSEVFGGANDRVALGLFAWVAEVGCMYRKLDAGNDVYDHGESGAEDPGEVMEGEGADDMVGSILRTRGD